MSTAGPIPPRPDIQGPPPATWRAFEAVPVFVIALIAGAILSVPVYVATPACSARFVIGTLMGEVGFVLSVLVWVRYVNGGPLAALGFPRRPLQDAGIGIGAGVALVVLGAMAFGVVNAVARLILGHQPPQPQQVLPCVKGAALAYLAPVVVLGAPLGEETFFRGFLFKGLRRRFSLWPAVIISAAAFAAVHFAGISFLLLVPAEFVVGIGLALVYEYRQSLLASMTAHAAFNLVGFLLIAHGRS